MSAPAPQPARIAFPPLAGVSLAAIGAIAFSGKAIIVKLGFRYGADAVTLAIERIGSGITAQIGMLGPVSTIVLSVVVLGEPMGPWQIAGTLFVLAGIMLVARARPG